MAERERKREGQRKKVMPPRQAPKRHPPKTPSTPDDASDTCDPLELLASQVRSMGIGGPTYDLTCGGYVGLSITTYSESRNQKNGYLGLPVSLMEFFGLRLGQLVDVKVVRRLTSPLNSPRKDTSASLESERVEDEEAYIMRANCFEGSSHSVDVTGMRLFHPKVSAKGTGSECVLYVKPHSPASERFLSELKLSYLGLAEQSSLDCIGPIVELDEKSERYFRDTITQECPLYEGLRLRIMSNGCKRIFEVGPLTLQDEAIGYVNDKTSIIISKKEEDIEMNYTTTSTGNICQGVFEEIRQDIASLASMRLSENVKKGMVCSAIISGAFGTGKRTLVKSIAQNTNSKLLIVDSEQNYDRTLERIAQTRESTLVLIPNVEIFISKHMEDSWKTPSGDVERERAALLKDAVDRVRMSEARVFIIATTEDTEALGLGVERGAYFPFEYNISALPEKDKRELFRHCLHDYCGIEDIEVKEEEMDRIIALSSGFTANDVVSVMRYVVTVSYTSDAGYDGMSHKDIIFPKLFRQLSRTTTRIAAEAVATIPKTKFHDIGGLEDLKERLRELADVERFGILRGMGIRPPTGCLLYGPPGCAKTLMARALAGETHSSFLVVSAGQLISPYVGESEKKLRHLFKTARHAAPTILFFDELDAMAPVVGSGAGSGTSRLVSALASELDDVRIANESGAPPVVVVGATNSPYGIDRVLLRGGRFDVCVYVGTPDERCREAIFRIHTREMPIEHVSLESLASRTEGYTGAEIAAVCQYAGRNAIKRGASVVTEGDMELGLLNIHPRTTKEMIDAYRRFGDAEQLG